ncbi:MAG: Fpg/Nei family DNA glycosylase [Anaerolineales bacterium]|nr:Fpg/Nei family DNA glycosylase [Anaerolineales bacterium]
MPELPEITSRAREMHEALTGKSIKAIEVLQPKCLNLPKNTFIQALTSAKITSVSSRGKWIFIESDRGWLLLNLGMGGEILLTTCDALPEKRRLTFEFHDASCLSINFWWFGYAHFVPEQDLADHKMTAKLGSNAIELTFEKLEALMHGRRGRVKSFLLDQSKIAGIGNAYVHDILFMARLHPMRTVDTLSRSDIQSLAQAIQDGLQPSIEKGGAFYEMNLLGEKGGFTMEDILVGYKEGEPCPECGSSIEKIKTGSTSSFICPSCQSLETA